MENYWSAMEQNFKIAFCTKTLVAKKKSDSVINLKCRTVLSLMRVNIQNGKPKVALAALKHCFLLFKNALLTGLDDNKTLQEVALNIV